MSLVWVTGWLQVCGWAASKQIRQAPLLFFPPNTNLSTEPHVPIPEGGGGGWGWDWERFTLRLLSQTPQKTVFSWKTFLLYLTFLFFLSPSTPLLVSAIQVIMPSHLQICSYGPLWTTPVNNQCIFPLTSLLIWTSGRRLPPDKV